MFSVTFFLIGRQKTITGNMPQDCWITFKKDFHEEKEKIRCVEILKPNNTSTLCEFSHFLQQYVTPEYR